MCTRERFRPVLWKGPLPISSTSPRVQSIATATAAVLAWAQCRRGAQEEEHSCSRKPHSWESAQWPEFYTAHRVCLLLHCCAQLQARRASRRAAVSGGPQLLGGCAVQALSSWSSPCARAVCARLSSARLRQPARHGTLAPSKVMPPAGCQDVAVRKYEASVQPHADHPAHAILPRITQAHDFII